MGARSISAVCASSLALAVALTHPVRPGCFQKTKQEVLGWWVGKEKLSSRSVGARSISAFCASSLAPKDRSAHSAPLVLFCCGTAGKLSLRPASGAPRLAGEGAHGNLSMISCRLRSGSSSDNSPAERRATTKHQKTPKFICSLIGRSKQPCF